MSATLFLLAVGYRDFVLGWLGFGVFWWVGLFVCFGFLFFFLKSENYCYKCVVTLLRWVRVLSWDICILSGAMTLALFIFFFIAIPSNSRSSELANLQANTGIHPPRWQAG